MEDKSTKVEVNISSNTDSFQKLSWWKKILYCIGAIAGIIFLFVAKKDPSINDLNDKIKENKDKVKELDKQAEEKRKEINKLEQKNDEIEKKREEKENQFDNFVAETRKEEEILNAKMEEIKNFSSTQENLDWVNQRFGKK